MAGGAAALERAGLAAGGPVAVGTGPDVAPADAVAAALAVEAAGGVWIAAADAGGRRPEGERPLRLALPGEDAATSGAPALPAAAAPWRQREPAAELADRLTAAATAKAGFAAAGDTETVSAEDQAAAGLRLAERLGRGGNDERRPIAVASLDLATVDGRTVLAWALAAGAALLLEADPRDLPGTAAWARPTVAVARAAGARALAARAGREASAPLPWWRRPFGREGGARAPRRPLGGRLEALVLLGADRLGPDELAFWLERGVRVVPAVV